MCGIEQQLHTQVKAGRPVQFEITERSKSSMEDWLPQLRATDSGYLFPSRREPPNINLQYADV
jgi:hypothetical protein